MQKQKQNLSTRNQLTQSHDSGNPQRSISIRKAAARLKQKQSQIDIIRKRFQVLKGQQEYNRYRTLDQQRRINHHKALHESLKTQRQSMQNQLLKQQNQQNSKLKQRHDKLMQQMRQRSKQAYDDLLTSRISDRNRLKSQSLANEQAIERNRQFSIELNAKKREEVVEEQKKQKALVEQFKNSQIKSIIGNRMTQAAKLAQLTDAKDKELQRLMEYEQEMLKKASQSIACNQKVKDQFGKVFVEVKQKNSVRLPTITRHTGTNRSKYSTISRNLSIYEI